MTLTRSGPPLLADLVLPYAADRGGHHDLMHILVIDGDGGITGVPGSVLEKFLDVSKASDARSPQGANIYYKDVIKHNPSTSSGVLMRELLHKTSTVLPLILSVDLLPTATLTHSSPLPLSNPKTAQVSQFSEQRMLLLLSIL